MKQDTKAKVTMDLSKYYFFGLTMLQATMVVAALGLIITALYVFCSGGTAG